ncbi:MAG: site-2 protease family protein [Pseudomonadota bacterium]
MAWSISLGSVFGSEIRIHLTFLLLLVWIGIAHYVEGGAAVAMDGVLFIAAVFGCVLLHELGHAVAARRYGIRTPDITLLPIGGMARLERIPEDPGQEIVIAIAGPLVNVVIAAFLILVLGATLDMATLETIDDPEPGFLVRLAAINIFLVIFNTIPAFPMDGGRVLRALLATRYSRTKATRIAANTGQILSFFFGFFGLMAGNPILVFIAIFVYLAAAAESGSTELVQLARRLKVDRAMITHFEPLDTGATVGQAAKLMLETTQHEFPVVDGGGRLRGFLTREQMVAGLHAHGPSMPVLDAIGETAPTVEVSTRLDKALERMQADGNKLIGVTDIDGRFVGYISQENIAELMMLGGTDWAASTAGPTGPRVPQR